MAENSGRRTRTCRTDIGQGPQKYLALGVACENGADYLCSGGKFVEQRIGRSKILRMYFNHTTPADID